MTGPATATVTPLDVRQAASVCHRALQPVADLDWDSPAGSLHLPSARRWAARDEPELMGTVRDGGSCRQGVVFQSP